MEVSQLVDWCVTLFAAVLTKSGVQPFLVDAISAWLKQELPKDLANFDSFLVAELQKLADAEKEKGGALADALYLLATSLENLLKPSLPSA